ncbi:hypothetical protein [Glycocaulis sp.]|uniref:hypothetical protein n=1 Tax=Glycocaulis sp. TaxID=1969725 RepID=UPI003D221884
MILRLCSAIAMLHLTAPAQAQLYKCEFRNRAVPAADGLIIHQGDDQFVQAMAELFFDVQTGSLRLRAWDEPIQYDVIHPGDVDGGHNMRAIFRDSLTFLNIAVWEEGMPFVYYNGIGYFGGGCERVAGRP